MTGRRPAASPWLATLAVLALYGVLLQAFLSAALPSGPAFLTAAGGFCAPAGGTAPADERPADRPSMCCIAACAAEASSPPALASVVAAPLVTAILWPDRSSGLGAIPTTHAASARGPPFV